MAPTRFFHKIDGNVRELPDRGPFRYERVAPAGRELKCPINRAFTDHEVDALVAWCESVAQAIVGHGASAASEQ